MPTTHEFLAELSTLSSEEKPSRPISREVSEQVVAAPPISDLQREELLKKIDMLQNRIDKLEILYLKLSDLQIASKTQDPLVVASNPVQIDVQNNPVRIEDKLSPVDVLSKYGKDDEEEPMPATDDPANPNYMPDWANTKEGE